jgi:hypothetical protein
VDVRQVWVHGDFMRAIDPKVLREALDVQKALIGNGFEEEEAAEPHLFANDDGECYATKAGYRWGFHSPLMYWNCSLRALKADQNLLSTINARSGQSSALNLTFRPSTVFAGKAFSNMKLQAADALVITLFDQTNSSLGAIWDARSRSLAEETSSEWSIFPKDGQVVRSRLYEFHFKPMTLNDDLFLAATYFVTAAYVIWRLMQLRAFKSWFGLLVTICAKVILHAPIGICCRLRVSR